MNVLGIIAEYNPLHNGHLYHLSESKRISAADYTVCVMSGNFTQRGEPALIDKWTRAQMAVNNGIDLVLELPFIFACNNAEYFARGGVDLLDRLGCITHLSFGSESGSIEQLKTASELLINESEPFKQFMREFLKEGNSYPKARYEAIKKFAGEGTASVLKSANNILGVEYLRQLTLLNSKIQPITVMRYGTGYHDKHTFEDIASATAIRDKLESGNLEEAAAYIPQETLEILETRIGPGKPSCSLSDFYPLIMYKILISNKNELKHILSISEGLENKVIKAARTSGDMNSLIKGIKSKRYTETRIQRMLVHLLVTLEKESFFAALRDQVMYGRILGFSRKGAELLKQMKTSELSRIPLITNINREVPRDSDLWRLLSYDILTSDIYNLVCHGESYTNSDYVMKPYNASAVNFQL